MPRAVRPHLKYIYSGLPNYEWKCRCDGWFEGAQMIVIQVDAEIIRDMARALAKEARPWDELVWLFAEWELRLRPTLVDGMIYKQGEEGRLVDIDPAFIIDHPPEGAIRELAEEIAHLGPSFEDLHWFIAERRFIYDQARLNRNKV